MRLKRSFPVLFWFAPGAVYLLLIFLKIIPIDNGSIVMAAWLGVMVVLLAFKTKKNLLLSLAALFAFLALAEGVMAVRRSLSGLDEIYSSTVPYVRPDQALGWSAIPRTKAYVTKINSNGVPIFRNVPYIFDSKGRRTGPGRVSTAPEHALVFGGSFAFGHGLPWSVSLSARLENLSKGRYKAYCYSLDAYGPGQMRELLAEGANFDDIGQERGLACYWFIPHHLGRNVLLYDLPTMIHTWSRSIYYRLGKDGSLYGPVKIEDNKRVNRIVRSFHRAVRFSPLFEYLWAVFKPHIFVSTEEAAATTARLIIDSARSYRSRFKGRFIVIFSPQLLWQGRGIPIPNKIYQRFKFALAGAGIEILTIPPQKEGTLLFNSADRDGHPSAAYYDIVARQLLRAVSGNR